MALKPSTRLSMLLILCHLLVAGVVFLTALPVATMLTIFLLIVLSLVYYLARDALLLLPNSWREIALSPEEVSVVLRNGSGFTGQVSGETFISPHFIVLGVRVEDRRLPFFRVIFPDALGRDRFREVCVRLRFA
ncbi:MAG TPA: protein YgfX [Gallionella sp.]|nr:protein YgfX [Gallionella sp.]